MNEKWPVVLDQMERLHVMSTRLNTRNVPVSTIQVSEIILYTTEIQKMRIKNLESRKLWINLINPLDPVTKNYGNLVPNQGCAQIILKKGFVIHYLTLNEKKGNKKSTSFSLIIYQNVTNSIRNLWK